MKSIIKTIVNSITLYQFSGAVMTWYTVGLFSESLALWCISFNVLCWVCMLLTPYTTVLVKHQSHPDHIRAITTYGFNKPHNEEKLIAQGYDAKFLGQLGKDNISFTSIVLDKAFDTMLRKAHGVDTLDEIWVRVRPTRVFVSQAVSFGWLNINHGWGIEVTADRAQVNALLADKQYTLTKPTVTLLDYINLSIILMGCMCSPYGIIDTIESFKTKKLDAIKF